MYSGTEVGKNHERPSVRLRIRIRLLRARPEERRKREREEKEWRKRVEGGGYGAKKTVVMPRATEIRRNFNIRWRIGQEGAGDVIPLTNGRLLPDASWQTGAIVSRGAAFERNKRTWKKKRSKGIFRGRETFWIESKQFRRALSPKQIARSSRAWWVSPCPSDNCIGRARRVRERTEEKWRGHRGSWELTDFFFSRDPRKRWTATVEMVLKSG